MRADMASFNDLPAPAVSEIAQLLCNSSGQRADYMTLMNYRLVNRAFNTEILRHCFFIPVEGMYPTFSPSQNTVTGLRFNRLIMRRYLQGIISRDTDSTGTVWDLLRQTVEHLKQCRYVVPPDFDPISFFPPIKQSIAGLNGIFDDELSTVVCDAYLSYHACRFIAEPQHYEDEPFDLQTEPFWVYGGWPSTPRSTEFWLRLTYCFLGDLSGMQKVNYESEMQACSSYQSTQDSSLASSYCSHVAARGGHEQVVRHLLFLRHTEWPGIEEALYAAAETSQLHIIELLLPHMSKTDFFPAKEAFKNACRLDHVDAARLLLRAPPLLVDSSFDAEAFGLYYAVKNDSVECVRINMQHVHLFLADTSDDFHTQQNYLEHGLDALNRDQIEIFVELLPHLTDRLAWNYAFRVDYGIEAALRIKGPSSLVSRYGVQDSRTKSPPVDGPDALFRKGAGATYSHGDSLLDLSARYGAFQNVQYLLDQGVETRLLEKWIDAVKRGDLWSDPRFEEFALEVEKMLACRKASSFERKS
jgi:hypothetical protein